MALLSKVSIGCGCAICNADSETVAATQRGERETVKNNFLGKKLGLSDGLELVDATDAVLETHGWSERNKYRSAVGDMITKHFGKAAAYAFGGLSRRCSGFDRNVPGFRLAVYGPPALSN